MTSKRHTPRRPWIAAIVLLALPGLLLAQSDQPTLDELLDLAPTEPATDQPKEAQTLDESIEQAMSMADAADAFEQAVVEMDGVARRIGRSFDTGVETQRMQESILRKLEQVIKAARQQNSGGGGGSGQPQDQDPGAEQLAQQGAQGRAGDPSGTSNQASTGEAGVTTPIEPENQDAAIEQLRKEWGVLPPRVREELSDGLRERFSPLYRRMTEAYYKALAEQE